MVEWTVFLPSIRVNRLGVRIQHGGSGPAHGPKAALPGQRAEMHAT